MYMYICIYMYIYVYICVYYDIVYILLFLDFLLIFLKNIKVLAVWVPWRGHDALVAVATTFEVCLVS